MRHKVLNGQDSINSYNHLLRAVVVCASLLLVSVPAFARSQLNLWHLENNADDSVGSSTYAVPNSYVTGQVGSAGNYSSLSSEVSISELSGISEFSSCAYLKPTMLDDQDTLYFNGLTMMNYSGKLYITNGGNFNTDLSAIESMTWVYFCYSTDGTNLHIYKGGVSGDFVKSVPVPSTTLRIGGSGAGLIADEISTFDTELTDEEIAIVQTGGEPFIEPGMFDEGESYYTIGTFAGEFVTMMVSVVTWVLPKALVLAIGFLVIRLFRGILNI